MNPNKHKDCWLMMRAVVEAQHALREAEPAREFDGLLMLSDDFRDLGQYLAELCESEGVGSPVRNTGEAAYLSGVVVRCYDSFPELGTALQDLVSMFPGSRYMVVAITPGTLKPHHLP